MTQPRTRNEYLLSILKNDLKRVQQSIDILGDHIMNLQNQGFKVSKDSIDAFGYLNREEGRLEGLIYELTH
jgi:pyruvate-formate lyase